MGLQRIEHFKLADGTYYYYDAGAVVSELLAYTQACARADFYEAPRPPLPEVLKACAQAEDRRVAFFQLYPNGGHGPDAPSLPIVPKALIERGELVPRPL